MQKKVTCRQLQENHKRLEIWCQLHTNIAEGFAHRKFKAFYFCCTVYIGSTQKQKNSGISDKI